MFLLTNDTKFEHLFQRHIAYAADACAQLASLLSGLPDDDGRTHKILEIEHLADALSRDTHTLLDSTFITRLDKPDIVHLSDRIDDIVDGANAVAARLVLFRVQRATPEALRFVAILIEMTRELQALFEDLHALRLRDTHPLMQRFQDRTEAGDRLLQAGRAALFVEGADWRAALQWQDVYAQLDGIASACEDVANTVVSIVRKQS